MIVCAGGSIYDFAINKLYPQEELITIEGHQEMRLHTPTGTLIFFSYHPSVIKSPRDFYDNGVMYHYREFLKNQSKMKQ